MDTLDYGKTDFGRAEPKLRLIAGGDDRRQHQAAHSAASPPAAGPATPPPHHWMLFVLEDLHRYATLHGLDLTRDLLGKALSRCEPELLCRPESR